MQFTKSLRKNYNFKQVYQKGTSAADKLLVLITLPNHLDHNRLGITVSKKIGNSVVRSRATRLIKEAYRLNEQKFHKCNDYVFVARVPITEACFSQVQSSLLHLLKKLKLCVENGDSC